MLEVYWGCLIVGALIAVVTILFGEALGGALDAVLDLFSLDGIGIDPMTVVGGITIFGGAGVLLTRYTDLGTWWTVPTALAIALVLSAALYFFYLKPMKAAENSTAFSVTELVGSIVEVTVPIPAKGYGEVMVSTGTGRTNQIAASWERKDIPRSSKAVVVEVNDGILYVSPYDAEN
jgi:membrane protein implicated in regulation of membrane protease activity